VTAIPKTVGLAHEHFGPIVLPFHQAIGEVKRKKLNKGQDFLPPVTEGRKGRAQFRWPSRFTVAIQASNSSAALVGMVVLVGWLLYVMLVSHGLSFRLAWFFLPSSTNNKPWALFSPNFSLRD